MSALDDLLGGHAELVLSVNRRGGQEDMDAGLLGVLDRLPGAVDVAVVAAGQAADGRAGDLGGDGAHGVEVPLGGDREAGLDDVHPQRVELAGKQQLLRHAERKPWRLLTVAQRRVEDGDVGAVCGDRVSDPIRVDR
jgi:hypothetical protein